MQALAFGDLHGRILAMYDFARHWSETHDLAVEVVLQVGDFGIFPDPLRLSEEKMGKYGPGDYAALLESGWRAPVPTYFCKGNNEDFEALREPLIPGLHWVADGEVLMFGSTRVAFIGGGWAPKSYASNEGKPNHLSRAAVQNLMEKDFDVLVCHEAPAGSRFRGGRYAVGAPPLRELIESRQPRLVVHGHQHTPAERTIGRSRVIALDLLRPSTPDSAVLALTL